MPKIVTSGSFNWGEDYLIPMIVDDHDVLRKCAGSQVVDQWDREGIVPIPGHSLIHLIALGATETTGPNSNADGFRAAFLKKAHPTFIEHGALYKDHRNKIKSKRYGDILKTAFNDEMGRVELLVAANHDKCAKWLSDIEKGKRKDFSMGFDCAVEVCDVCGHRSKTRGERCKHMCKGAKPPFGPGRILEDGRKCFVDNPEGVFNDISDVPVGADRIAQHLRKIDDQGLKKAAGVHEEQEECLSGADLAELYQVPTIDQSVKMAILSKASRIEKQIPCTVFRPDKDEKKMSDETTEILQDAEPSQMFGELAKTSCLLDFREFFKLMMGSEKFAEIEAQVDRAEPLASRVLSIVSEDPDRSDRIVRTSLYDADKRAARLLSDFDRLPLVAEFSIDPGIAESRLTKQAIGGPRMIGEYAGPIDPATNFLIDQYAAYKIAALAAMPAVLSDELLLMAAMTA